MKAAWYSSTGDARTVLVVGEIETPSPGPGEVRIRLAASGVNPSDVKSRRRPMMFPRVIPHSDGAGTIDAVGEGVSPARVGERVWIWNGQWQRPDGTAAEYIVLPQAQAVALPAKVDFATGACMGIPLMTAFQAVRLLGDVSGKTILVTGAGSAVGHYITQLATHQGAKVIGTAGSPDKIKHAASAGAVAVIDYKKEDVAARVKELTGNRGADAVIDMDLSTTVGYLRDGALAFHGTIVCYGSNVDEMTLPFRSLMIRSLCLKFFLVYDLRPEDRNIVLAGVSRLLEDGALSHTIAARFPLAEIAAAHEAVESGALVGNVVIEW